MLKFNKRIDISFLTLLKYVILRKSNYHEIPSNRQKALHQKPQELYGSNETE